MKTYRITENDIKGLKPVAVGFKIFQNDWTTKNGYYDYKDENGNVIGTIHKVDGDIEECKWGLHFSKNPQDCFNFYECIQWNKFAKVEAYDKLLDCDKKSVTNILKIVETYTFDEFINLIQEHLQSNGVNGSNSVSDSKGVNDSNGVNECYGVNDSNGVNECYGVNDSNGVNECYGVNDSKGVSECYGVNDSKGVSWSKGVNECYGVSWSKGVSDSKGVSECYGVNGSKGVSDSKGVSWSKGVSECYGIVKCEGVSRSVFCYKKSGDLMAFNKQVAEERFNEINNMLKSFYWYPQFNNAEQLRGNLKWYETNIPAIVEVNNKTAWSFMPQKMLEYIKSIPEYDEVIFNKITGDID